MGQNLRSRARCIASLDSPSTDRDGELRGERRGERRAGIDGVAAGACAGATAAGTAAAAAAAAAAADAAAADVPPAGLQSTQPATFRRMKSLKVTVPAV